MPELAPGRTTLCGLLLLAVVTSWCAPAWSTPTTVPGDPLTGTGKTRRSVLTYGDLFSNTPPTATVDDGAGFAVPAQAAAPSEVFEGALVIGGAKTNGGSRVLAQETGRPDSADAPARHLVNVSLQFVQNGSHLIPVQQGLLITGDPDWNYIVGPGRVWKEKDDRGYMRAAFPFALAERNQNCLHNGAMTFLFNPAKTPNISKVRYQVTQETCAYFKLDMWGLLPASYVPGRVPNAEALQNAAAEEVAKRIPTKPLSALATDYPDSGITPANFTRWSKSPADITAYGVLLNGVHYVSDCPTRHGAYAFCDDMRLPSYSTAKALFAGVALMWLGQQYGIGIYAELIKDYVSEYVDGGDWSDVTFSDAADMATGNYISAGYQEDEGSPAELAFLVAEAYAAKIEAAFKPFAHHDAPGTRWVYQSHATFILTQAMNAYLQRKQGPGADLFNAVRDAIFKPLHLSQGSLTSLRTDNSPSGKPIGAYGMFLIRDDVAKLGRFLNNDGGTIRSSSGTMQVLEPTRLRESLFRTKNPATVGVPVPEAGGPAIPHRYHNHFWSRHLTTAGIKASSPHLYAQRGEPQCDFWVPFMSGYGGITVLLMPDGANYYNFSDGHEFLWLPAALEIDRISRRCH